MRTFIKQMVGAARFDARIYEQVEADPASTIGAVLVVLLASIAAAVGLGSRNLADMAGFTLGAILSWIVWIALTLIIGKWALPDPATHTNIGEIVRTTGFSAAPGVFRIFGAVPGIGLPIFLAVTVWMLFTFVVAIRQALDYTSFNRALAVCLLGWLINGLLFFAFVAVAI